MNVDHFVGESSKVNVKERSGAVIDGGPTEPEGIKEINTFNKNWSVNFWLR